MTKARDNANGGSGLILIKPSSVVGGTDNGKGTISFSGQTSISLNGCFNSTYNNYKTLIRITDHTADTTITLKLRNGSTDISANYYYGGYYSRVDAGGSGNIAYNNTSSFIVGEMDIVNKLSINNAEINIFSPNSTNNKSVSLIGLSQLTTGSMNGIYYGGGLLDATACNGLSLISSSGTITGTISVYGYNN